MSAFQSSTPLDRWRGWHTLDRRSDVEAHHALEFEATGIEDCSIYDLQEGSEEGEVMDDAKFWRVVDQLLMIAITAQREAAIAQALAVLANPSISEATRQEVRRKITGDFDALSRRVAQAPVDEALELLRRFEGTVQ